MFGGIAYVKNRLYLCVAKLIALRAAPMSAKESEVGCLFLYIIKK